MSINSVVNRIDQNAADQKLADGLTKHQPTLPFFTVAGTSVKTADIIATLQARITAANAVDSARATWRAAVQTERNEHAKSKVLVSGVRQALQIMFAGSIDTLGEYGLTPRKPRVVSPEKKVAAAAKAKATRAARHTAGKKQKLAIKGAPAPSTPADPPTAPTGASPTAPPVAPAPVKPNAAT